MSASALNPEALRLVPQVGAGSFGRATRSQPRPPGFGGRQTGLLVGCSGPADAVTGPSPFWPMPSRTFGVAPSGPLPANSLRAMTWWWSPLIR